MKTNEENKDPNTSSTQSDKKKSAPASHLEGQYEKQGDKPEMEPGYIADAEDTQQDSDSQNSNVDIDPKQDHNSPGPVNPGEVHGSGDKKE
ncbi:hypothetical protein GCM10023093_29370 [Nemorincola caseinilytica]|uniref:Uncharacterized protein n=1 Tax=Nemorincola caseinilytica TaxID=2054315 RepID=A0ABP8NM69_9BACT